MHKDAHLGRVITGELGHDEAVFEEKGGLVDRFAFEGELRKQEHGFYEESKILGIRGELHAFLKQSAWGGRIAESIYRLLAFARAPDRVAGSLQSRSRFGPCELWWGL